jgi:alkylated DNA repair dioxygenase AlkB
VALVKRWIEEDGELEQIRGFIPAPEASEYFRRLREAVEWHGEEIRIRGRSVPVPRLVAWYGDPGAVYRYSGVVHEPSPWILVLAELRQRIEAFTGCWFNSVLCNLYRDGKDSMGWHADDEPELGNQPFIASLSFGAERRFRIRHREHRHTLDILLQDGDLLLMKGELQRHWWHCVPKTVRPCDERINLTFRAVIIPSASMS